MNILSTWMLVGGSFLWVVVVLLLCHYYYDRGLRDGIDAGRRRGWTEAHNENSNKCGGAWTNKGHPTTGLPLPDEDY